MDDLAPLQMPICPYVTSQRLLQGKWAILVLHYLADAPNGTLRFNQLLSQMPTITHSTLSSQLKSLERDGLVSRSVYPETPPRVEYALTPIGERFRPVLDCIGAWGDEYIAWQSRQGAQAPRG